MLARFPITGEKTSVVRPIVLGIVRDLTRMLNILPNDIDITYVDEEGTRLEKGSSLDDNKEGLYTKGTNLITLTVSEELFQGTLLQHQDYQQQFLPVFIDEGLGLSVTPYYIHNEMKISITYRANSKASAKAWLNSMRSRITHYGDAYPHLLQYHYEIDDRIIYILSEMYRMAKIHRDLPPLGDWLQDRFSHQFGVITDVGGVNTKFALSEAQNTFGYFDFDGQIEEGQKEDGYNTWNVSFEYLVRYQKPAVLNVYYPLVVCNNIVNDKLLPVNQDEHQDKHTYSEEYDMYKERGYFSQFGYLADMHSSAYTLKDKFANLGIAVPYWNEFIPKPEFEVAGTRRFVDQLMLLEGNEKAGDVLMDLRHLDGFTLHPDLLDFIVSEDKHLLMPTDSVFQIMLYEDDELLERKVIDIVDGEVVLKGQLQICRTYNIRIAIYDDWSLLNDDALRRLKKWLSKHPDMQGMFGWEEVFCSKAPYGVDREKNSKLYYAVVQYLAGEHCPFGDMNDHWGQRYYDMSTMKTVQTFETINISPKYRDIAKEDVKHSIRA